MNFNIPKTAALTKVIIPAISENVIFMIILVYIYFVL